MANNLTLEEIIVRYVSLNNYLLYFFISSFLICSCCFFGMMLSLIKMVCAIRKDWINAAKGRQTIELSQPHDSKSGNVNEENKRAEGNYEQVNETYGVSF